MESRVDQILVSFDKVRWMMNMLAIKFSRICQKGVLIIVQQGQFLQLLEIRLLMKKGSESSTLILRGSFQILVLIWLKRCHPGFGSAYCCLSSK